jgi:hypothetical protein
MNLISKRLMRHVYACNRCGEKIGDHNYTIHIIRHAFQDMEKSSLIHVIKSRHEYDEVEHLGN